MFMAPLPPSLSSNDVQNLRLMSNTEALHCQDRKVQIVFWRADSEVSSSQVFRRKHEQKGAEIAVCG